MSIASVIGAINVISDLEKRIEALVAEVQEKIKSEKNRKKREDMAKALKDRNGDLLRKYMFDDM